MREKLREWIRVFLGIDNLPTKGQLAGVEQLNRDRHSDIISLLNEINVKLTVQHVNRRPLSPDVMGYEEAQIEELANMLANPPKED